MTKFLEAIPAAATSPFAFAAYAIAGLLFIFAGAKLRLAKLLLDKITDLPENERRLVVEHAAGTVLPTSVSPEEWIRHSRLRWTFLLIGALLIGVIAVSTIALLNPSHRAVESVREAVVDTGKATQRVVEHRFSQMQIDLWRQAHGFGTVSGTAGFHIDLPAGASLDGLDHWLRRVTGRYKNAKQRKMPLDRGVPWGDGTLGDEYVEVNASAKRNWDLCPQGDSEALVDQLLFNPYVMFMVSKDSSKTHLLAPSVAIATRAESIKVFFDSVTQRPKRIETFSAGPGRFNPIAGQFTNWLDLYGATLFVRVRITVDPKPAALALARHWSLSFETENDYWHARASIPSLDGRNVLIDRPGSVVVVKADWNTLGSVPNDYPGERIPEFGAPSPIQ